MQNSTVFVLDKNENSREIIKSFIENLDFVNEVMTTLPEVMKI